MTSSGSGLGRFARPEYLLCVVGSLVGVACDSRALSAMTSEMAIDPPKPILDGYTADPHAAVFDGTYYVYPTSDDGDWLSTEFSCWSSRDLVHWTNKGVILDLPQDLGWAKTRAWAPAMIARDGRYFFYFAANLQIGVAVSDEPAASSSTRSASRS